MLHYLRIANLALMESVELEFERGFTAVTGETGAGKSVLLGALSLLAGNRAEKTIIRQGADTCEVEGYLFFKDPSAINRALEALGLPACEDGALVLRRSLSQLKPPRIHVNGALATLAALQTLGEQWVDFHGPGEPQKLFKESVQLDMLDAYGRIDLSAYRADYAAIQELQRLIADTRAQGKLSDDEIAFYQSQIEKIDTLAPSAESIAALERDFTRLNRSEELRELSSRLEAGLSGDGGIADAIGPLLRTSAQLSEIDPSAEPLHRRLESAGIELNDLAQEFSALAESGEIDAETAQALQARMAIWMALRRKYGNEPQDILDKRDEWAQKIARQGDLDGFLAQKQSALSAIEKRLKKEAAAITLARQKAATALAEATQKRLVGLGFKKAGLTIAVLPLDNCGPSGDSRAEILFSPNPGTPPLPLRKIASGGETARVMLAIKTALADIDDTPVLVFDEVDANVGGEIGGEVGHRLAALADRHQVFCVTHLPQVAALAQNHFLVSKTAGDHSTAVSIAPIHADTPTRMAELARMLGDRTSKSALAHAQELLDRR